MSIKKIPHKNNYYQKVFKSILFGSVVLIISITIGIVGYHHYFKLSWVDSLLNASMILTGMGPVDKATTDAAKLFSSFYALYSGVAFLTSVAVIFSPIVHRFLHKFHADIEDN